MSVRNEHIRSESTARGPDMSAGNRHPIIRFARRAGQALLGLGLAVAGCSSTDKPDPTPLRDVVPAIAGSLAWQAKLGGIGFPLAVAARDSRFVAAGDDGTVLALDADTGAELWAWDQDNQLNGVSAAPTVAGRQLLFTTNAGRIYSMLAPDASVVLEVRHPPGPEW